MKSTACYQTNAKNTDCEVLFILLFTLAFFTLEADFNQMCSSFYTWKSLHVYFDFIGDVFLGFFQ